MLKNYKIPQIQNIKETPENAKSCNCRRSETCPLNGKCTESCIVYRAEVKSDEEEKTYYGACVGPFKERFRNHKKSILREEYREDTKLSKYVWELKDKNKQFEIAWSIVKKMPTLSINV